ncbi:MAG TPA: toprim domain-containing protein, partial [Terriglobales bacterium]|nr:toprim domain-containing protein [Terriglobales bacterium]
KLAMMSPGRGAVQPQISLLDYLEQHGWKIARDSGREEVAGFCPLHRESRPSFYVNRRKQVFYCHGCGRGGGLGRLIRWLEGAPAPGDRLAVADRLLEQTYGFYREQLQRNETARAYLAARGIHDSAVIEAMRIGYAPGACLRAHLWRLGYGRQALLETGLIDERGRDAFFRCLTFPLVEAGNLYGRSVGHGLYRHRFLPGSKGGLYGLAQAPAGRRILIVEGLFDLAALWQAGFPEAVAALGSHLNNRQLAELCQRGESVIHICFDADRNGSGQRAARGLSIQLRHAGLEALRIELPEGHDPASFFASGATAYDFQRYLEGARP